MNDAAHFTSAELDARDALAKYKLALIMTGHRSAWHRLLCWSGVPRAKRYDQALQAAERHARAVARRSDAHRCAVRTLAGQQRYAGRDGDKFLALLCD